MTKVKFIQDFRGVETGEVYYKKGDIGEVDDKWLERIIQDKRAVIVDEPKPRKRRVSAKPSVKAKVKEE